MRARERRQVKLSRTYAISQGEYCLNFVFKRNVVNREKRVVVLAEADVGTIELLFNEAVAVEVVCCLERKERAHAHNDRAQHFIADVEIVVGEAAALMSDNPVIGVVGGIFRHGTMRRCQRRTKSSLRTPFSAHSMGTR